MHGTATSHASSSTQAGVLPAHIHARARADLERSTGPTADNSRSIGRSWLRSRPVPAGLCLGAAGQRPETARLHRALQVKPPTLPRKCLLSRPGIGVSSYAARFELAPARQSRRAARHRRAPSSRLSPSSRLRSWPCKSCTRRFQRSSDQKHVMAARGVLAGSPLAPSARAIAAPPALPARPATRSR